ncbi:MAG: hypothetical protein ABUL65_04630 [Opitutus sp.]
MKHLIFLLTCTLAILAGALSAAPVAPTPADSLKVRQHVDALLKVRRKPEALPVDPPNPFAVITAPGTGAPRESSTAPTDAGTILPPAMRDDIAAASSTELLARFASRLRITGLIRLKDQVHVIINDSPWREGDFIIVNREPRLVQLQVVKIQPGLLTLRLDDAELVLRF